MSEKAEYLGNEPLTAIIAAILFSRGAPGDNLEVALINARWLMLQVRK